jgi:hypothetical protein
MALRLEDNNMEVEKKVPRLIDLEKEMLKLPQKEAPVFHNFADGVYIRELHIPGDSWIMGKRHRYETCNILLKGKLSLYMGPGIPAKTIEAPLIFNSEPGVKKFAYAHEDTIFLNVHPTIETDVDKIEEIFIISEEEYKKLEGKNVKCLGQQQ